MARVFVPGYGAPAGFYRTALGERWLVHEPPAFRARASFAEHVAALQRTIAAADGPLVLAGHSLGAAAAIAATAAAPERIARLLLIAPAGLPLTKPLWQSVRDFARQAREGVYPRAELRSALTAFGSAPVSALRLARAVRALDLRDDLEVVRRAGVDCEVVACAGDTLTPAAHCRRIAELSGARFRDVAARGGHMWLVVDPAGFAAIAR